MSETVSVDEKGRLVIPKKVREKARIGVNVKLVAKASGIGRVELSDPKGRQLEEVRVIRDEIEKRVRELL